MNILVTGAGRGIGYETVKEFASRGKHNIIALSRNKTKLDELVLELKEQYPQSSVLAYSFDLELIDSGLNSLYEQVSSVFPTLDILVNNAGLLINSPFEMLTAEDELKMWKVNYLAPSTLIRSLMPLMGINEKAHVVNISSMGGVQGSVKFPGLSSYSASKSAIATLTECLAEEFKDRNIAFNCIALGSVQTEMLEEAFPGYKAPVSARKFAEYLVDFCLKGKDYCNGKILPYSLTTP